MTLPKNNAGFSLVEMSIVLVIIGFVLVALLVPLAAQREQLFRSQTANTLELARKALLGYAQSRGRLPCPATAASAGIESETTTGNGICTSTATAVFLPAATLGIQPTDPQGFAIDGWNNRIRYAVTQATVNSIAQTSAVDYTFTTSNGMSNAGISNLAPSLRVCNSASVSTFTCSTPVTVVVPEANYLINNAVAVIFSTGPTAVNGAGGANETENLDGDRIFVSRDITATVGNEFDHLVVWISPYVLYNAMVEAGQLH